MTGAVVTERPLLRRVTEHEATAPFALDMDPEVVRYAESEPLRAPRSPAEVQATVMPDRPAARGVLGVGVCERGIERAGRPCA